jgi:hypothetical protein
LREAFRDVAGDKGYVTESDLKFANLSPESVRYLAEAMPAVPSEAVGGGVPGFDCEYGARVPADTRLRVLGPVFCEEFGLVLQDSLQLCIDMGWFGWDWCMWTLGIWVAYT